MRGFRARGFRARGFRARVTRVRGFRARGLRAQLEKCRALCHSGGTVRSLLQLSQGPIHRVVL